MFNLTKRGKMTDRETIDMVKGLTDAGNSTMEIIKMPEQSNEKLILLAKKLSLVELQLKLSEEIEVINTRIACLETDNEDSIPF